MSPFCFTSGDICHLFGDDRIINQEKVHKSNKPIPDVFLTLPIMATDFMSSATYMALYIVTVHVLHTSSRTSTHWRLNAQSGRVEADPPLAASGCSGEEEGDGPADPLMEMLVNNRVNVKDGEWRLTERAQSEGARRCYDSCTQQQQQSQEEKESVTDHGGYEYKELNVNR